MGKLKIFTIAFTDDKLVYHPGDKVSGVCVVELKEDMKMKALRISNRGVAKVHWTESRSTGTRLGSYTEHYNAEVEYFFKRQLLFGADNIDGRNTLSEGRHEFNFSFDLPIEGIATSFEGKHGSIRYWLKAEIDKPWSFNHKTKKCFTVISPIDINIPEYMISMNASAEKTLCCWLCTSGPISINACTDRKAYCPGYIIILLLVAFCYLRDYAITPCAGESITVKAAFENFSSRNITPYITLHQNQTFYANGRSRLRNTKFTSLNGLPLRPGAITNWTSQLLKIPSVSPTIVNCCIIRVEYYVKVALQILGTCDLSLRIPIVIGTVPQEQNSMMCRRIAGTNGVASLPPSYSTLSYRHLIQNPPAYNETPVSPRVTSGGTNDEEADDDDDITFSPLYTYVCEDNVEGRRVVLRPPAYSEVITI